MYLIWKLEILVLICFIVLLQPSLSWLSKRPAAKTFETKAVIKDSDMTEDMQQAAVKTATVAMDVHSIENDIAAYIKKEFDKKYEPTWHCIVGRNFGYSVTQKPKNSIYFYFGQVAILLFKSE